MITVEEELAGWYALIRQARRPDEQARAYERLAEAIPLLARWRILPMVYSAIIRYESLKRMKLNVRKMDLRIASIVLEHGAKLVTQTSVTSSGFPACSSRTGWLSDRAALRVGVSFDAVPLLSTGRERAKPACHERTQRVVWRRRKTSR